MPRCDVNDMGEAVTFIQEGFPSIMYLDTSRNMLSRHCNNLLVSKLILHYLLLHWICSYQMLFIKVCSKCERLLTMDRPSALLLPPVHRQYQCSSVTTSSLTSSSLSTKDQSLDLTAAYHVGCSPDEA